MFHGQRVGESLEIAGPNVPSSARDGIEVFKLSEQLCHGDFIRQETAAGIHPSIFVTSPRKKA